MRRARVLIIDDEEIIVSLFQATLGDDFEVIAADDGDSGLNAVRDLRPDVVISDIKMPRMDGLQFLERAKELDPDVPIVFCTAFKNLHHLERALQLGAFDMIDKPFELQPTRLVVERALAHRRRLLQRRRLEVLARHLNGAGALSDLLGRLEAGLAADLGVRLCSLWLHRDLGGRPGGRDVLELVASNHVPLPRGHLLPLAQLRGPMLRAILESGASFVRDDERRGWRSEDGQPRYGDDGSLSAPLLVGDRLVGVLDVNDKLEPPAAFDANDRAFLGIAAEHLASAIAVRQETARVAAALDELRATQRRLIQSEKLAALTKLVAGVAHELKNPLTSLHLGAVNLGTELGRGKPGGGRAKEFLTALHEDIDRLQQRVESFLAFARPERGERSLCAPAEVVDLAVRHVAAVAAAANVRLAVELAPGLPQVLADPEAFREAVVNLLVNGVEASAAAARAATAEVRLKVATRAQADRSWLVVVVEDSGPGIPAEVGPHVFELFFTTKAKGSGIGLAQVHVFCDTHGGWVRFESSAAGTSFQLALPAAAGA